MFPSDVFNLQKQGNDQLKYHMVLMDVYLGRLAKKPQVPL